jgi:hypothetical protein
MSTYRAPPTTAGTQNPYSSMSGGKPSLGPNSNNRVSTGFKIRRHKMQVASTFKTYSSNKSDDFQPAYPPAVK